MNQSNHITTTFESQRAAVSFPPLEKRLDHLSKIETWIKTHRAEIFEAHNKDLGKPESEVELAEIWYVMSEIKVVRRNLHNWMARDTRGVSTLALSTARSWVHYEPKGIVLIISPWNFPFNLTVGPLVSALAAGNRVIIKPSEMTPHVSALIQKMVTDLFEPNHVAVFQGDAEVAKSLLELRFDHIFFTGSPAVGKIVMAAAAKHLASVTLELGGKSPTIIDETAHLNMTVKKLVWGKCINAGQSCIAPDYILVHKKFKEKLIQKLSNRLNDVYGVTGEEKQSSPDFARIVNHHHWDRVNQLLEKTVHEGGTIAHGGGKDEAENFIEPTLINNVKPGMKIMEEEIFGPLLPILSFESLDECINIINARPKPLALYLFSNSRKNIDFMIQNTSSGGMVINEVKSHFLNLDLPFGGVNTSGFGRSHGQEGFKSFSNARTMLKNGRMSMIGLTFPPYTDWTKKIIRFVSRYL
tara:strand:- start:4844 stop:6250 length:1407 start_codon:yes stop_codon:yes gene_type:complete